MRQMLQTRSPTVRLISSFLPNCLPPRQSIQFITSPLAQAIPPSQAALSRLSFFARGLHTAATLPQGTTSPSRNPRHRESETMMGSSTSTPATGNMQQEAHHHEAAGAFPLPSAPPMSTSMSMPVAPHTINTQDSESHSDSNDSNDSNISNSSTHKDASAKRKAHDSAQTAGPPKRAKTDDTKVLSQDIGSLAITNITSNINIDIDIDIDNMTTADAPVDPLAVVKQWLAEREAHPSPLTPTELNAIVALKATLGRIPEPELGMADWVSLLHRYRDARQQQCGAKFEFEDMVNEDKSFSTICIFTGELGAPPLRFPGEHGGLLPVDHSGTPGAPSFLKKKDARKYAAKCCVEWLMANGYMPADGSTANLSRIKPKPFRIPSTTGAAPAAPASSAQTDENARPASNGTTAPSQGSATPAELTGDETATSRSANGAPRPSNIAPPTDGTSRPGTVAPSPSPPVPTSSEDEMTDFEVPATLRVKELCENLGICQPQYIITPSPNHGRDFFDGRANFLADDPYFEDGVGRVFGGYTKKGTRERVAEQVLVALLEISAKREAAYKALLEDKARG